MTDPRSSDPVLPYSAAAVSGAAALLFEIAAARLLAPTFGATPIAATLVLGTFLGALALGAWWAGRTADRAIRSGRSAMRVARDVAVAGALLAAIAPNLARPLGESFARGSLSAWPLPLAIALIAAIVVALPGLAMGGPTAAWVAALGRSRNGSLYAMNTAGAVIGAILATTVAIEHLGVAMSCRIAALLLLGAGALAHAASRGVAEPSATTPDRAPSDGNPVLVRPVSFAFACGFGGLAVEVFGIRALHQVLPGSSQALGVALAVFLAGNALGAWLAARFAANAFAPVIAAALPLALILALVLPIPIAQAFDLLVVRDPTRQMIVALALLPGALASGAAFAVALRVHRASGVGASFGAVTLANTLGALLCAFGVGVWLVPEFGVAPAAQIAASFVALSVAWSCRGGIAWASSAIALAVAGSIFVLDLRALPPLADGDEVLAYREGVAANVAVVRAKNDPRPGLFSNRTSRQGGGSSGERVERRQGVLPALVHAAPKRALVLGVGTGATIEGLLGGGTTSVDAVEIVPEILDELGFFAASQGDLRSHPNVTLVKGDAVAYAARTTLRYDLIVGDLYFPWSEGASLLYSVEHFENVREKLAEGGAFWQWMPLHQLRFEDFGKVAETFRSVFGEMVVFLADLDAAFPVVALVGSNEAIRFDHQRLTASLASRSIARAVGLETPEDLYDLYLGDRHTLAARFGTKTGQVDLDARITFDRPRLEFLAARTVEPETVLALNNWNNLALQLGDTIEPMLDLPTQWPAADRNEYLRTLRTRASASRQYLLGRYWHLRARWIPDDALGDELREAEQYQKVLLIAPTHAPTGRAVDRLLVKRLAERRYQQVVDLGRLVLAQNPGDGSAARNVGLALLLLGQTADACTVLEAADRAGKADSFALTAFAVACYLERRDDQASAIADRALAASGAVTNHLASAVKFAATKDSAGAKEMLARVIDHAQWGAIAKRIDARLSE